MAIVRMQRVIGTLYNGDCDKLMKLLVRLGVVEVTPVTSIVFDSEKEDLPIENNAPDHSAEKEINLSKMAKLAFAIDFLKAQRRKAKEYIAKEPKENKTPYEPHKYVKPLLDMLDFENTYKQEEEIFDYLAKLEKINDLLLELNSERLKLTSAIEQLKPYSALDIPFSQIKDTKYTGAVIGIIPDSQIKNLAELTERCPYIDIEQFEPIDRKCCIVAFSPLSEKQEMIKELQVLEFSFCTVSENVSASEKVKRLFADVEAINIKEKELVFEALTYDAKEDDFCKLYDFLSMENQKYEVMEGFSYTQATFSFTGWIPKNCIPQLNEEMEKSELNCELEFREPLDSELPPTATKNNKFTSAFDDITNMFGAPNYRERDPNFFMAIFYFLFFGIMISDAGYGLLMAIACFLFIKITKPKKNSGKMIIMFGLCGVSTVIWGALFGGWFALTLPEGSFLDTITIIPPLEKPLLLFALALGMGALHLGTGYALKGIDTIKKGGVVNVLSGICNSFCWVLILLGLLFLFPNLLVYLHALTFEVVPAWFGVMGKIGTYIAIAGFVLLVLGGIVGRKNPLKMATGIFGNLYGSINVMSDLISYARLFGLGLTTGVIGFVINKLCDIIINNFCHGQWFGWIIASILFVVGHVFNLAINLLGAYVHDSRLQYIEFFGRFYEGSGKAFVPFGMKTKYVYLDNGKIQ